MSTVHLVDDEAPVRAALAFLLASHGFSVQSYDSGQALLQRLAAPEPLRGCILLDVRMEPLSGLQVHDELVFEVPQAEVEAAGGALGTADRLDGLTVDRGDWWYNLRPSNTEPLLRLNVEAKDDESLRQHVGEVLALLKELD